MGNIVKSASSVYPKKECYAVGAKPKLGRGSKRKKQLQQQGQSSKAVDGICSPSPLHLNGLICRCYIFLFFSLEVIFASQGSLVHSTPQKWSGLKILGFQRRAKWKTKIWNIYFFHCLKNVLVLRQYQKN